MKSSTNTSSTAEIHPNPQWRRWKSTAVEWLGVIISGIAVLIALVSANTANRADIRTEFQYRILAEQQDDLGVLQIRTAKLDAWLKAHGIDPEEIYDEPTR
jgi:hypothetical protein